jgi:hypothetical protein
VVVGPAVVVAGPLDTAPEDDDLETVISMQVV